MERILIVDDDIYVVESLKFALKDKYDVYSAYNSKTALELYTNNKIAVTILDMKFGKDNGLELYHKIREINLQAIVIITTVNGNLCNENAKFVVEAIKSGVFFYLTKPVDCKELELLIAKGVEINRLYEQISYLNEEAKQNHQNYGIIAKSDSMKNLLNTVEKIKNIDSNVLITGESGTGKSVIAKIIHKQGNRKNERFNTINCAAIPRELLESELFGYKKGAFTGATTDKKGYFELSNKGTLFLDEIGDMDISLQGKLLNAIQEKTIIPLGSGEQVEVDVRIITATNRNIRELVNEGKFREDLFYRLNVINIYLPPLRERREDIPYLVDYFVCKYSKKLNKNIDKIEYGFIKELEKYDFSGNVRELQNLIERAIALTDNNVLSKKDILGYIQRDDKSDAYADKKLIPIFIGEKLDVIEKKVIEATYKMCNYNQRETAELLGITDRTIRNKLKKYSYDIRELVENIYENKNKEKDS